MGVCALLLVGKASVGVAADPVVPFSGLYFAVGAGMAQVSLKHSGRVGKGDRVDLSQKLNLADFPVLFGIGRPLGAGLYVGVEAALNIMPRAHQKTEEISSHGVSLISMGPSKVSCCFNARFGILPMHGPVLLFLMVGGAGTKASIQAFSERCEFFAITPCVGGGVEYAFSKRFSVRCDICRSFGESEGKTLSGDRIVESTTSITPIRFLLSFYPL
jgi:opacity protein-like surface antigen